MECERVERIHGYVQGEDTRRRGAFVEREIPTRLRSSLVAVKRDNDFSIDDNMCYLTESDFSMVAIR